MTQDEIIEMAKGAGFSSAVGKHIALDDDLERFAKFIASAEREACVKAIEDQIAWDLDDPESTAIKAIRARGQT